MRIIHLSDIHYSRKSEEDEKYFIIEPLIEDLKKIKGNKEIDIIALTGDLVFKGGEGSIKEGFEAFSKKIINKITNELNIAKCRIFIVPGNHDIDRGLIDEDLETGLTHNLINTDKINKFIDKNDITKISRIMPFKEFEKEYYEDYEEKNKKISNFESSFICEIDSIKVGISCYNSAWRCSGDNDNRKIILGERQVSRTLDFIKECKFKIGLMHHHIDNFVQFDIDDIKEYIEMRYDLFLCGHSHIAKTWDTTKGYRNIIVSVAPANWTNGIRSDNDDYYNGYSIIDIDLLTGKTDFEYRKYSHKGKKYILNEKIGKEKGRDSFYIERLKKEKKDEAEIENKIVKNNYSAKIPSRIERLFGRKNELTELKDIFMKEINKIVFIAGLGGIGKTSLLTEYFYENNMENNVIWIYCSENYSLEIIIERAGFGDLIKVNSKYNLAENFISLMNEKSLVLVLDDFHRIESNAVLDFLSECDKYLDSGKVIIISRDNYQNLNLSHTVEITLDGLENDELEYINTLLNNEESNFSLNISNEKLIKLCKELKGHPLAIKLAVILITKYNEEIDNLIEQIPKYAKGKELSNRLLGYIFDNPKISQESKEFLCKFSVLSHETDNDEIIAVIGGRFKSHLEDYIDKLMITASKGKYIMHPIIREFCYEKLELKNELHNKAADYFIEKTNAESINIEYEDKIFYNLKKANNYNEMQVRLTLKGRQVISSGYKDFVINIMKELNNYGLITEDFYLFDGMIKEIEGNLDKAKKLFKRCGESKNTSEKNKIYSEIKYNEVLYKEGEVDKSLYGFINILNGIGKTKFKIEIALCLNNIGVVFASQGKYEEALKKYEESLKIREEIGDKSGKEECLNGMGRVFDRQGKYEEALKKYEESLKISEEIGDKSGKGTCLNGMGSVFDSQGKYEEALKKYEESLKICEEIGDKSGKGICLNNIGGVYDSQGKYEEALKKYEESLKICEEIGDKSSKGKCLNGMGSVFDSQGKYEEALKKYEESLKISEEIGDKSNKGTCLNNIGGVYNSQGEYEEALKKYEESLKISEEIGDKSVKGTCLNNIGIVYNTQKNYEEALKKYEESLKISEEIGDKSLKGTCLNNIGGVYSRQENYEEALKKYKESLKISEEIGEKLSTGNCLNNIGLVYSKQKKYEEALLYYVKSLAIYNEIGLEKDIKDSKNILMSIKKNLGYIKFKDEVIRIYNTKIDSVQKKNIDLEDIIKNTTIKNEDKVGRNNPCPCGSGKKYKNCCEKKKALLITHDVATSL